MANSGTWFLLLAAGIGIALLLRERQPAPAATYKGRPLGLAGGLEAPQEPLATYENTEEWELVRGADGRIEKVIIHRRAVRTGD